MKILLTNDDGIEAQGIKKLAEKLAKTEDIYILAPPKKLHGISCSVTFDMPVKVEKHPLNLGEAASYRVYGTPADCIILGLDALTSGIDLVISGINDELNIGDDIRFSGTIGACMEAAYSGIKSFGISMEYGRKDLCLDTAVELSSYMVQFLKENKMPKGVFLNINIPNLSLNKIKGIKFVKLGRIKYKDRVHKIINPYNETFYWISGKKIKNNSAGKAIENNYIAITPMTVDYTSYKLLEEMQRDWKISFP